jgi:hypothetical protein
MSGRAKGHELVERDRLKLAPAAEELLTKADAARVLNLTPAMVRIIADQGQLPLAARTLNGGRLFRLQDVVQFRIKREAAQRQKSRRANEPRGRSD